jgi:hypothetical protein
MPRMRRLLPAVVLLTAGALLAGCASESAPVETVRAAGPQTHALDWVERYPGPGPALVFRVTRLALSGSGWSADVAIENRSGVPWELPEAQEAFRRQFGLMLFATGDLAELDRLNDDQSLPPVRKAERFSPAFPTFLAEGETWTGRMSATGSLPAGSFARVVFGPFVAVADPPQGMEERVVWITDHAQRIGP